MMHIETLQMIEKTRTRVEPNPQQTQLTLTPTPCLLLKHSYFI